VNASELGVNAFELGVNTFELGVDAYRNPIGKRVIIEEIRAPAAGSLSPPQVHGGGERSGRFRPRVLPVS
jgi:hypothetical protein